MEREPVSSTIIASVGYDATSETLEIEFVSGDVHRYLGVSEFVVRRFLAADSLGAFFNRFIRDAYDSTPA